MPFQRLASNMEVMARTESPVGPSVHDTSTQP